MARAGSTEVNIKPLNLKDIIVTIEGDSPLVAHRWSEKAKKQIRDKQQKKGTGVKREAKNPDEEFNGARMILPDGKDGIPSRAIKRALIESTSFMEGVSQKIISGTIWIGLGQEYLPVKHNKKVPTMREDFVRVNSKGPGTGVADLRYRPEYNGWSVDLPIRFDASIISPDQIIALLERAGTSIGILEDRPGLNKGGQWGMFHVKREDVHAD